MTEKTLNKLRILANAAKYDVSCSSSGTTRKGDGQSVGNTAGWGICHSFSEDGRCISLLKVMMTNACMYDCAYCINRKSNQQPRAGFTPDEVVELTIEFYRRNYIEGLFLSSGVIQSPDYTMAQLVDVARKLRTRERYNGYIHLKSIPGASAELIRLAGLYADRLSVNIEIATEANLQRLAPDKNFQSVFAPMNHIRQGILESGEDRKKLKSATRFVPAGQSTQLIIGATPDSDQQILQLASNLYQQQQLKRVYYSGYIPVNTSDSRLPALSAPPLVRENRLYQADWLLRFYQFKVEELVNDAHPDLDLALDPKLGYALRNPQLFPIDINKADFELILRIPGIGVKSAQLIISARRYTRLTSLHLKKMGVVLKRAKYFISCNELSGPSVQDVSPIWLRKQFTQPQKNNALHGQLSLFGNDFTSIEST